MMILTMISLTSMMISLQQTEALQLKNQIQMEISIFLKLLDLIHQDLEWGLQVLEVCLHSREWILLEEEEWEEWEVSVEWGWVGSEGAVLEGVVLEEAV
jgi:hypothetical protein